MAAAINPSLEKGARRWRLLLCGLLLLTGCGEDKPTSEWVVQLQASDSSQRLHAIKALAGRKADAQTVVPALIPALKDQDAFVRRDAATALGRLGRAATDAVPALLPLLRDHHASVRKAAASAIKKIDPEAATKAHVH